MKNIYLFTASLIAIALGTAPSAQSAEPDDIGLDFGLSTTKAVSSDAESSSDSKASPAEGMLGIPAQATQIPLGEADSSKALTALPPPPEPSSAIAMAPTPAAPPASATAPASEGSPQSDSFSNTPSSAAEAPVELSFNPFDASLISVDEAPPNAPQPAPAPTTVAAAPSGPRLTPETEAMFEGGSDSLVARAIGSAEGTRTPTGERTAAYKGHTDPGNGVWNLGTFSYQHGANSPEEADQRQLARLKQQAQQLARQAEAKGLQLSLEEQLNALDLANQSPRAALNRGGYIDRLKQAQDMGLTGEEAILWARTRSFLDPDTERWNAPGLGNTVEKITADQERRRRAIAKAIAAPMDAIQPSSNIALNNETQPPTPVNTDPIEQNIDSILNFNLPDADGTTAQTGQPSAVGA